jgi:RNase adapter protein RapZ
VWLVRLGRSERLPLLKLAGEVTFKYGIPVDADLVVDCRFLPNPHWVEDLRRLPGTDERVRDYVLGFEEAKGYLSHIEEMLEFLLPAFTDEGKHYLTLALGCTGGHHRSVVLATELTRFIADLGYSVDTHHRDLERE